MKFEISRRARREIERINDWWVAHRDDHDLFLRELAEAEIALRAAPQGEVWRRRGGRVIRRWLLAKSGHHLYYRFEPTEDRILVVAAWGATRGSTPKL